MENLKNVILLSEHQKQGARLVPFAGFLMPVQYSGVMDEHRCVRERAGLFDVSHMGEIRVQGKEALPFLQWLTPNDLGRTTPGQAQYNLLCKPDGTVLDDLIIYRLAEDHFFLCVNAANIQKDFQWIQAKAQEKHFSVTVTDESERFAQLALQGPLAQSILQRLTSVDLASIKPFHFMEGQLDRLTKASVLIARTGYTGEDGFELYFAPEVATILWTGMFEHGRTEGLQPIGLGARDTLRLEMKYPLYGNDLDEHHTAIESGLSWVVKFEKPDFIGRAALAAQQQQGPSRKWIGLQMLERGIPRGGYAIFAENKRIGEVTSGTHSPSLDIGIGCAYVACEFSKIDTPLEVEIRGQKVKAKVVKTPFYRKKQKELQ